MSAVTLATRGRATTAPGTLWPLARLELRRWATHPLFLLGFVACMAICIPDPDPRMSSLANGIAPATLLGVASIFVGANLVARSDLLQGAAGVVPVTERTRTLALAIAAAVPFAAGLVWWAWSVAQFERVEPTPDGFPFGALEGDTTWAAVCLFAQGPMAAVGGALLGILVGRWLPGRAAPALTAVAVIALCIVLQGIFDPLRRIHVLAPWTYFGGPYGVEGDPERMMLITGSVYWWSTYLVGLCALGLIAALLHDRERPRRSLARWAIAAGALTLVLALLAMWTGTSESVVNPIPSPLAE